MEHRLRGLLCALTQRLENAVDGRTSGLECAQNVLCRALEQSNQVCNKFVLALDVAEEVELLLTYVSGTLDESSLQSGLSIRIFLVLLGILLDQFCRHVARVAEHDGTVAFESVDESLFHLGTFESFGKEGVLHNVKLDLFLEAIAAVVAALLSVKTFDVGHIEVCIIGQKTFEVLNNRVFIFLLHKFSFFRLFLLAQGITQSTWDPP